MPVPLAEIALIVTALSIVQSVFGMGILVFGTPTLLLLGVEYKDVLGCLLPSSLLLSALQIVGGRALRKDASVGYEPLFCIPFIAIGLLVSLRAAPTRAVQIMIGAFLILAALIRMSERIRSAIYRQIKSHRLTYLGVMGAVHGFSNMGGALLAVYAAARTRDKSLSRFVVACFYFVFGATQMIVLVIAHPEAMTLARLSIVPAAAAAYVLVGNRLYRHSNELSYQHALTLFTGLYGASLLIKAYL